MCSSRDDKIERDGIGYGDIKPTEVPGLVIHTEGSGPTDESDYIRVPLRPRIERKICSLCSSYWNSRLLVPSRLPKLSDFRLPQVSLSPASSIVFPDRPLNV